MTNENQPTTQPDSKPTPFGERLKAARETMGLDRKEAAAQLRLNEKLIVMMEKDRYPVDLPVTFIRGYIRAYGKLLQIPEYEIRKGIEPIKPITAPVPTAPAIKPASPVTSGNYFMQFFTYLIVFTLIALVGTWWYTHQSSSSTLTENQISSSITNLPLAQPVTSESVVIPLPPTASSPSAILPDTAANHPPLPDTAANHPPLSDIAPIRPADPKPAQPANRRRGADQPQMQPSIMQPPPGEVISMNKPAAQSRPFNEPINAADLQADEIEPVGDYAE